MPSSSSSDPRPHGAQNPFSTRRVRPGAVPFLFPKGIAVETLVDQLRRNGWWGQITGAHGSGKSTLLATLRAAWEARGRTTVWIELHDGQRRLPDDADLAQLSADTQLAVDGYEQLSRWSRAALARRCRQAGCGLIVTAHGDVGLPPLFAMTPDRALARRIVQSLTAGWNWSPDPAEVDRLFARHHGDLREFLFAMYDLYESRRS